MSDFLSGLDEAERILRLACCYVSPFRATYASLRTLV